MDAVTSTGSHTTRPSISKAAMPVKCIAAMPPPTISPPSPAAAGSVADSATANPTHVRTIATISDRIVRVTL